MSHYSTPESIERAKGDVARALSPADEVTVSCWRHLMSELDELRKKVERYEQVDWSRVDGGWSAFRKDT